MEKKQKRYTVSFRESSKEELELHTWLESKKGITPVAITIKEILYKAMLEEKSKE